VIGPRALIDGQAAVALTIVVLRRTGSPLLASLTFACRRPRAPRRRQSPTPGPPRDPSIPVAMTAWQLRGDLRG
jgi:hypothetical protein